MEIDELKDLLLSLNVPTRTTGFSVNQSNHGLANARVGETLIERGVGCLHSSYLVYVAGKPIILFDSFQSLKFDLVQSFGNRSRKKGCYFPLVYVAGDNVSFYARRKNVYDIFGVERGVDLGVKIYKCPKDLEIVPEDIFRQCVDDHLYPFSKSSERDSIIGRICESFPMKYSFLFRQKKDSSEWRLISSQLYDLLAKL